MFLYYIFLPLLEVADTNELDQAIAGGAKVIRVNNRNLIHSKLIEHCQEVFSDT